MWEWIIAVVTILVVSSFFLINLLKRASVQIPESVNYHFTRQCNYSCGFCFHTAKTSFVMPEGEAKRGLKLLKEAGKAIISNICISIVLHF